MGATGTAGIAGSSGTGTGMVLVRECQVGQHLTPTTRSSRRLHPLSQEMFLPPPLTTTMALLVMFPTNLNRFVPCNVFKWFVNSPESNSLITAYQACRFSDE